MAIDNILYYLYCLRILPPFLEDLPSSHSWDGRRVLLVSNPILAQNASWGDGSDFLG